MKLRLCAKQISSQSGWAKRKRAHHQDARSGTDGVHAAKRLCPPQVRGLYSVSFPIMDSRGHAIAALTVPYAERIDRIDRKSIATVETLSATAETLSRRMGGGAPRGSD